MLITLFDLHSQHLKRKIAFLGKSCPVSFRANSMLRWNSAKFWISLSALRYTVAPSREHPVGEAESKKGRAREF